MSSGEGAVAEEVPRKGVDVVIEEVFPKGEDVTVEKSLPTDEDVVNEQEEVVPSGAVLAVEQELPKIEDDAVEEVVEKDELVADDKQSDRKEKTVINVEKERIFMEKVNRQTVWYTSSVITADHGILNWRAQVIHNYEICLQKFDSDPVKRQQFEDKDEIEIRRCALIARVHSLRKILREVMRARDQYVELVKKQKRDGVALDIRDAEYTKFCLDINAKLNSVSETMETSLKPELKELERKNEYPRRVAPPVYKGRQSPLSFARLEMGFFR